MTTSLFSTARKFYGANKGFCVAAIHLLLLIAILLLTEQISRASALERLRTEATESISVYAGNLSGELDKYSSLPFILARHPQFSKLLDNPEDSEQVDAVNRLLAEFNHISKALNIYILDANGVTLASSNWDSDTSFVGEDLSFRPYFQDAMTNGNGYYFALGSTSKKRGFYFSAAVPNNQKNIGVLVVKVNLYRVEEVLSEVNRRFAVSDPDGVVFISNETDWIYHTMAPLDADKLTTLRNSRRYADHPLKPLPFTHGTINSSDRVVSTTLGDDGDTIRLLHHSQSVPERGWVIHAFSDYSVVSAHVTRSVLAAAAVSTLMLALGAIVYLKHQSKLQGERIRQATLGALEKQVQIRTSELQQTNERLKAEIIERQQTARELTAAQDHLVQATKMATLGQMETSISHELNQPLGAIRAFADNAQEFIKRSDLHTAMSNLDLIADMCDKMRSIMQNLRSFARKTPFQLEPVAVDTVVNETLVLVAPACQKIGANLSYKPLRENVFVMAEPVRLQQVLTNLIQNSLDAVSDKKDKSVSISVEVINNDVLISVSDSGDGIDASIRDNLFEPFSSSKKAGEGLGLGLSLSQQIVGEFGGSLTFSDKPSHGATFIVQLLKSPSNVEAVWPIMTWLLSPVLKRPYPALSQTGQAL